MIRLKNSLILLKVLKVLLCNCLNAKMVILLVENQNLYNLQQQQFIVLRNILFAIHRVVLILWWVDYDREKPMLKYHGVQKFIPVLLLGMFDDFFTYQAKEDWEVMNIVKDHLKEVSEKLGDFMSSLQKVFAGFILRNLES